MVETIKEIPAILKELAATGSSNEKKRILKDTKSELLGRVFNYAYNHFITFGVHKIDASNLIYAKEQPPLWFNDYFELLNKLSKRELTGNAAKAEIMVLMTHSTPEYAELLMNTIKKDLRIGAGTRVINSVYKGLLPEDSCMAAMKYDPKRVSFPVYADTKLDGVRCIAITGPKTILFSRNAKEFSNYTTIEEEIAELGLPHDMKLDGEITMGHFQNLMRTLSRKDAGIELAKDAVYNIFDVFETDRTFEERLISLKGLSLTIKEKNLTHLRIVTGKLIETNEELLAFYQSQLDDGQEGIMVKLLDGVYEFKRSFAWQKMKPELSEDLPIIGFEEGTGKYKNQLGAVICKLENGRTVRVGSGFKDDERENLWEQREELIDRLIEVKYQEKTQDGSLRFPIFIRFRPDKE